MIPFPRIRSRKPRGASCCHLVLVSATLYALTIWMTYAHAGELSDCTQAKITPKTVDNCTLLIEAGQADKNDLAWAHFNRGTALGRKGQLDPSISDLDKAIELNPQWGAAYSNRGLAFAGKGRPDRAIEDYTQAIRLDPKAAHVFISRGILYSNVNKLEEALADFNAVISINPSSQVAYFN